LTVANHSADAVTDDFAGTVSVERDLRWGDDDGDALLELKVLLAGLKFVPGCGGISTGEFNEDIVKQLGDAGGVGDDRKCVVYLIALGRGSRRTLFDLNDDDGQGRNGYG